MISIVTDSTCDLPPETAQRLGITVIPMAINIEGRSYRDGVDITRTEYYARLPQYKTLPTTSASSVDYFEQAYRACSAGEIVSLHISASFSGVLNMARLGAEASGRHVTLIDSQQATMGLGWQVVAAAETAAAGGTLEKILEVIVSVQKRVKVVALLDTLEYLRRGGRASALDTALSNLLQIKLVIEVANGKISPLAKQRTYKHGLDKLVEIVEHLAPLERLAVMHAQNAAAARRLADRVTHCLLPNATPPILTDVTAIVGTHAGPGAVGVAIVAAR